MRIRYRPGIDLAKSVNYPGRHKARGGRQHHIDNADPYPIETGEMDVVTGTGSNGASRSSVENVTAPPVSSDRTVSVRRLSGRVLPMHGYCRNETCKNGVGPMEQPGP